MAPGSRWSHSAAAALCPPSSACEIGWIWVSLCFTSPLPALSRTMARHTIRQVFCDVLIYFTSDKAAVNSSAVSFPSDLLFSLFLTPEGHNAGKRNALLFCFPRVARRAAHLEINPGQSCRLANEMLGVRCRTCKRLGSGAAVQILMSNKNIGLGLAVRSAKLRRGPRADRAMLPASSVGSLQGRAGGDGCHKPALYGAERPAARCGGAAPF